jgi:S1-C subfamily serine protease
MCAVLPQGASAGGWPAPSALDYHTTVINGGVMGSAFALADGVAVTNAHVLNGLRPGARVALWSERHGAATGEVLAISRRMDLAILAVPRGFLPAVPPEDAPQVSGLSVVAAGVDAATSANRGERLALHGTVSAPRADIAAFGPGLVAVVPGVRHGFSGGPMFDRDGRLVGMVAAIRVGGSGVQQVSGSSFSPVRRDRMTSDEAFVLSARAVRTEAQRLLGRRLP